MGIKKERLDNVAPVISLEELEDLMKQEHADRFERYFDPQCGNWSHDASGGSGPWSVEDHSPTSSKDDFDKLLDD